VITKVQRWGNSQGVRLSKELLAELDLAAGDAVDIQIHEGTLVITPARRVPGGLDLAELMSRIPEDYVPEEVDWGPPRGNEVW